MFDSYEIVGGVFNPNWEENISFAKEIGLKTDRIYKDFDTLIEEENKKSKDERININVLDEGQGFKEKDTNKIFKRFYSNRPDRFGQHSGLGLNIVKNLVELHGGIIAASNNPDNIGARIEISFPKV